MSHAPRRTVRRTPRNTRPAPISTFEATARIRLHPRGFGFAGDLFDVVGDLPAGCDSVFVPPPVAKNLLDSDEVHVTAGVDADGRASALDARVTHRPRRTLAGTVVAWGDRLAIHPDAALAAKDWKLPASVAAPLGAGVVVSLARGGNGRWEAAEIVAGPFPTTSPAWVRALAATRALGAPQMTLPDAFRQRTINPTGLAHDDAIAAANGRDPRYSEPAAGCPADSTTRADRRGDKVFTVDAASSRDLDDAIVAWDHGDHVTVEVHIADVAAHVPAGSTTDAEAAARGTSVYLAGANLPMLPRSLSEGALSLLPGETRETIAVRFDVPVTGPSAGVVGNVTVFPARVSTAARLTYLDMEAHLIGATPVPAVVTTSVDAAARAAAALGSSRNGRDTLEGVFVEAEEAVHLGNDGSLDVHVPDVTPHAQALVERLMVAANESVARWLAERNLPGIYRNHPGLDPESADDLNRFAGRELCRNGQLPEASELREVIDMLYSTDPVAAGGFVTTVARAMGRATYQVSPGHHFGLDSNPYCHFTSPIRRYADLVVHRIIHAELAGTAQPYTLEDLTALAAHLDRRTGAAARAESWERSMLWSLVLGERLAAGTVTAEEATVSSITARGLSVRVNRLGISGLIPAGERWDLDAEAGTVRIDNAVVHLGSTVRVELVGTEGPTGQLTFAPAA